MLSRKPIFLLLALTTWLVSACSAVAGPKQIASAPRLTPIAEYPGNSTIIYQAYIELQVSDVEAAAARAENLAWRYGGYLTGSCAWLVDGRAENTLELVVPTANFDHLRDALVQIGTVMNETSRGLTADAPPFHEPYSSITLYLRSAVIRWSPPAPVTRWNPGRTFQRALDVFLAIFGFLADFVIWVVVVAGPFALIFFIAWKAARRLR